MAKHRLPGLNQHGQAQTKPCNYVEQAVLAAAQSGDLKKLYSILEKVDLNKVNFDVKQKETDNTPLFICAAKGHKDVLSVLLSLGCDVTLRNAVGQTVLDVATPKIQRLILDAVNRTGAGQALLWQAAWQGNATVVRKLLNLNPRLNINSKNPEGLTPLLLVTRDLGLFEKIKQDVFANNYNPTEVVAELLHKHADCTVVDNDGQTALHYTAKHCGTNAKNIISLLARKESLDVDVCDNEDYSALHFASKTGDPQILLALIDNGADVNARGNLGRTPLHITAAEGNDCTSGLLLDHGANILIVDDLGFTPANVAKGNKVEVLLKEAWTEQSQRSRSSQRIHSAPSVWPTMRLEHLEVHEITDNKNEEEQLVPRRSSTKKSLKKLQKRSHSEEQHNPVHSTILPRRSRSSSAGSSSRSCTLEPLPHLAQPPHDQPGTLCEPPASSPGYGKPVPSDLGLRQKRLYKDKTSDTVSREVAKLSILNIDLSGKEFQKQKSKSCSELPYGRYRVHKLSNQRSPTEIPTEQSLNLLGISINSFQTLPEITPELSTKTNDSNCNERDSSKAPLTGETKVVITSSPGDPPTGKEPQIEENNDNDVLNRTFNFKDQLNENSSLNRTFNSKESKNDQTENHDVFNENGNTDGGLLNRTFNSKEKPLLWFPIVEDNMEQQMDTQESERAFFVDFSSIKLPETKCSSCGSNVKTDELIHGDMCSNCHQKSVEKNCFWVPFDERNSQKQEKITKSDKTNGHKQSLIQDTTDCVEETGDLRRNKEKLTKTMSGVSSNKGHLASETLSSTCKPSESNATQQKPSMSEQSRNAKEDEVRQQQGLRITRESKGYVGPEGVVGGVPSDKKDYNKQEMSKNQNIKLTEPLEQQQNKSNAGEKGSSKEQQGLKNTKLDKDNYLESKNQEESGKDDKGHTGTEVSVPHIRGDYEIMPHEVVIVNPYPTPEPPKVAMVNVTSNCQCDRLASFDRNTMSSAKRKGKVKKSGASNQKPQVVKGNKRTGVKTDGKEAKKKLVNQQKGKKKGKKNNMDAVKEISVVQTDLMRTISVVQEYGTIEGRSNTDDPVLNLILELAHIDDVSTKFGDLIKAHCSSDKRGDTLDKKSITNDKAEQDIRTSNTIHVKPDARAGLSPQDLAEDSVGEAEHVQREYSDISDGDPWNADGNLDDVIRDILEDTDTGGPLFDITPEGIATGSSSTTCQSDIDTDAANNRSKLTVDHVNTHPTEDCVAQQNLNETTEENKPINFSECGDENVGQNKTEFGSDIYCETASEDRPQAHSMSAVTPHRKLNAQSTTAGTSLPKTQRSFSDTILPNLTEDNSTSATPIKLQRSSCSDTIFDNVTSWLSGNPTNLSPTPTPPDSISSGYGRPRDSFDLATTDSSYGSNGSTPRAVLTDVSSSYSTLSDGISTHSASTETDTTTTVSKTLDTNYSSSEVNTSISEGNDTSNSGKILNLKADYRPQARFPRLVDNWSSSDESRSISEKCFTSDLQRATSHTPTLYKGMKYNDSIALSDNREPNKSISENSINTESLTNIKKDSREEQFSNDLVHSRLSRRNSLASLKTNSDVTYSEEDEIVWKKGNMLGKGAFGTVWCGLTSGGQMIAVKQVELLTSDMEVAEEQYEKLQEEVGLLKSLRHENIVSYIGTCLDGGVVNIFMEFVPGGSIASVLARFGPLDESVYQYYTKQIVTGVEYLHRKNVVHRDIKGGNIMVMSTGIIKLIDFGCAKRLCMGMSHSHKQLLQSIKGTPYWMAPEVITETGHGFKSDIWSTGCTLYEMATGKPPWSHLPPMPAILAIGKGSEPPRLDETCSEDARDFIACSMIRDPDDRWSANQLLLHPFINNCYGT